ncbi:MAG: cytochrome c biogenesis protein, partial [Crocinitomicaceae bacterium]
DEFDKKIIKLHEKFQIAHNIFIGVYLKVIPLKNNANNSWSNPMDINLPRGKDSTATRLTLQYIGSLFDVSESNNYEKCNKLLSELKKEQRKVAGNIIPSEKMLDLEVQYNKWEVFKRTYQAYGLIGFLMLIIFFIQIFVTEKNGLIKVFDYTRKGLFVILIGIFAFHASGLVIRWLVSGHVPWSNGYEAVVFIAWVTMLAGFLFSRKNAVVIAGTAVLASLMIFVTELNLLDPEITPLQPVLKSYWLMIHVAVITGSYGFLGLACILGFLNLTLYIFRTQKTANSITTNITELTYISEMTMTIGVFMLTIGTFLGGIWANESWGRYWGWDPKETWALVSVLVYATILHLRFIPGLKSKFVFNLVAFWGYSAILFTFFGVNFVLVGLHSYAQGDGLGDIPNWIWITAIVFLGYSILAYFRNRSYLNSKSI